MPFNASIFVKITAASTRNLTETGQQIRRVWLEMHLHPSVRHKYHPFHNHENQAFLEDF